jgi:hypothetical protein
MRRQRLRRRVHQLAQAEQLRPRFVFSLGSYAFALAKVTQRKRDVGRWLLCPVLEQIKDVAGGRFVDGFKGPSGSSDDTAVDRGPVDGGATGPYSPSGTGTTPEAPCTAWIIAGKVVKSNQSARFSSVTSG